VLPSFGNSSRPVIPGMLMSERIRINDAPVASLISLSVCRLCKFHGEAAVAEVASELLAKQRLNIGFIVNNKNKQTHLYAPALPVAAMRGRMTLNSVNSPGRVSTSIDPACCLTIIS
jgi:hypothetical protein